MTNARCKYKAIVKGTYKLHYYFTKCLLRLAVKGELPGYKLQLTSFLFLFITLTTYMVGACLEGLKPTYMGQLPANLSPATQMNMCKNSVQL